LDKVVHSIEGFDLAGCVSAAENLVQDRYGDLVTPNVDHLIRYHDDPAFREYYAAGSYGLMDSRFVSCLVRLLKSQKLPVCTGLDLTATLLRNSVSATDRLLKIAGPVKLLQTLAKQLAIN
jgi:UDP-N-acetyl-D-mannosaminuronic acid transferase (WecB/TagA/CpsF family)